MLAARQQVDGDVGTAAGMGGIVRIHRVAELAQAAQAESVGRTVAVHEVADVADHVDHAVVVAVVRFLGGACGEPEAQAGPFRAAVTMRCASRVRSTVASLVRSAASQNEGENAPTRPNSSGYCQPRLNAFSPPSDQPSMLRAAASRRVR